MSQDTPLSIYQNHATLNIQDAIQFALTSHHCRMEGHNPAVCWIVSPPGVGKTEMLTYFAKKLGYGLVPSEPGLERIEKFGGIPDLNIVDTIEGKKELVTEWSVPEIINIIRRESEKYQKGVIWFLDDFHLCDEERQSLGFEIFTHRKLNGKSIPDNVTFILAGNDSSAAGCKVTLSAIRNRCTVIYAIPDVEYWLLKYAIPNNVHETVSGFFSDINNSVWFQTPESTIEQFASPRSWVQGVSANLNYLEKTGELKNLDKLGKNRTSDKVRAFVEGSVGREAGGKFMEYLLYYRHINLNELFDKGVVNIPKEPIKKFAYSIAISNELYRRKSKNPNDATSGKYFSKVLGVFVKENKELATKCLFHVVQKLENKKLGMVSGANIIIKMAEKNEIPSEVLEKLPEITQIMKR